LVSVPDLKNKTHTTVLPRTARILKDFYLLYNFCGNTTAGAAFVLTSDTETELESL